MCVLIDRNSQIPLKRCALICEEKMRVRVTFQLEPVIRPDCSVVTDATEAAPRLVDLGELMVPLPPTPPHLLSSLLKTLASSAH